MTQLVGVLNITPDSFSDGGQYDSFEAAAAQAEQLINDGAALIDVGAESTRPNATPLTPKEEWQRLGPVLAHLLELYPGQISVDTYHAETAEQALGLGEVIINDITGLSDPQMADVIVKHQATCIISHLPDPDIQKAHAYKVSSVKEVEEFLRAKAAELEAKGLPPDKIILDPGIGFGKTEELNRELLRFAEVMADYKVMIGYSRKRFLGEHRMEIEPNLAAGKVAVQTGAAYIRVHDVAAHRQLLY
jgi:dihydropteroate synthase